MANFNKNGKSTTVWLKRKTKKVFKGDRKGEEYDVFEGHLDIGGGKMIGLKFYADTVPTESENGEEIYPIDAWKWKGTPQQKRTKSKAW